MVKQAVKKKTSTKSSIKDIKGALNMIAKTPEDLTKSSAEKPLEFIPMPKAFSNALKLPGFPMGYMSIVCGWSNTGKSSIKNCLIASCINNGILPVIYETESNFDFSYAIDCGMKATPIYGDVEVEKVDAETGEITYEIENRIIDYEGDFLFYDNKILAEQYGDMDYSQGKRVKTKRKYAVIEDIAYSMNEILDLQDDGVIQQPICFIWDSVGSIPSFKSFTSKTGNNMFDAGSLSVAFNLLLDNRIPSSRKVSEPYTNTFMCVNKIWNDSMNSMGGIPSIELKGGKNFYFRARLIAMCGGMAKSAIKKLTATAKGETYNYGIISKIRVLKNQLPTPYNTTYEGEIAYVPTGMWCPEELDDFKKTHMKQILENIEKNSSSTELHLTDEDLTFEETESTEVE